MVDWIQSSFIELNHTGLDTEFEYNELEFPTVTVCPVDFISGKNETFIDYDISIDEYLEQINILMSPSVSDEHQKDHGQTTLRQVVFNLAVTCEDFLNGCTFRGHSIPCCSYFKPVYSERGFCYSFNARYVGAANNEWVEKSFLIDSSIIFGTFSGQKMKTSRSFSRTTKSARCDLFPTFLLKFISMRATKLQVLIFFRSLSTKMFSTSIYWWLCGKLSPQMMWVNSHRRKENAFFRLR